MNNNLTPKVSREILIKYYKGLIGNIFKILPLFEAKDIRTQRIVYLPEVGFENFQNYVGNLLVEVHGNSQLFFQNENAVKIASILKGMLSQITIDDHDKLKRLVFQCTSLCEKIIDELEVDCNEL